MQTHYWAALGFDVQRQRTLSDTAWHWQIVYVLITDKRSYMSSIIYDNDGGDVMVWKVFIMHMLYVA